MFFLSIDARQYIANHDYAATELQSFTGCEVVEVERDGHCGYVHNGQAHFLSDSDLVKFANHLKGV